MARCLSFDRRALVRIANKVDLQLAPGRAAVEMCIAVIVVTALGPRA
jgi:hypothetical protein